jgi:hypothetical protein
MLLGPSTPAAAAAWQAMAGPAREWPSDSKRWTRVAREWLAAATVCAGLVIMVQPGITRPHGSSWSRAAHERFGGWGRRERGDCQLAAATRR